ncbi:hypothetical protein R5H30_13690 [Sulfitobacter sp. D35]|uniref:hypothetical protein n=1 Tax=Sulfitobacter sp. D35 TaxID=3083252 RepID=UPI00296E400A|nr:hypothetical protein [Sulfitobacter sp. D35]MDW4499043.1 hypothetical protein [Sulfitobacter sp. D35]
MTGSVKSTKQDSAEDEGRWCDMHDARYALVSRADDMIESFGELFIEERFQPTCPLPGFESARMERFTRTDFPRILLDFDCFDRSNLSTSSLKADLERLVSILKDHPDDVARMADNLDDPEGLRDIACKIGLTEEDFLEAGGGLIGWVIVIAAAVVLTGCGNPKCGSIHRQSGLRCVRGTPHRGQRHRNKIGNTWP